MKIYLCYIGEGEDRSCVAVFDDKVLAERFLIMNIILHGVSEKLAHHNNTYAHLETHTFTEFEIHYEINDSRYATLIRGRSVKISDVIPHLDIEEMELNQPNFDD